MILGGSESDQTLRAGGPGSYSDDRLPVYGGSESVYNHQGI